MKARHKRVLLATLVGGVAWWSGVLGEIYFKCREPHSEACAWAHAFFPMLTVPLFFVMFGVPGFVIAYVIGGRFFRDER